MSGSMQRATRWGDLRGKDHPGKPWLNGMPRLIFVSDMSDALSNDIPFSYLESEIVDEVTSADGSCHQWLWLTKKADRMAAFSEALRESGRTWPANLWVGTSITAVDPKKPPKGLARIRHLRRVGDDRTIRFLSVEPQARDINLSDHLGGIDWVIQGGQSGKDAQPFDTEWARSMMRQCKTAGVRYFLKQLGANPVQGGKRMPDIKDSHGGDWREWPRGLRVRQMPTLTRMSSKRSTA